MNRAAFLANEDVTDRILGEQGVVNRQDRTARIAENHVHALILEGTEQHLGSGLAWFRGHIQASFLASAAALGRMLRRVNPAPE